MPETRYARSGDVSIAYQVFGEGPFDVVLSLPSSSHVELAWEVPMLRALLRAARLVRPGDQLRQARRRPLRQVAGHSSPETRMDDIRAVMDAAGSERAAVIGWSEGVRLSLLFAATYPERVWAACRVRRSRRTDRSPEEKEARLRELRRRARSPARRDPDGLRHWPRCATAPRPQPTRSSRALARMYCYGLSPGDEYAYGRMNLELDVRHVLSAIAVPTLVLQNAEDNWVPVEARPRAREPRSPARRTSRCRSAATFRRSRTWRRSSTRSRRSCGRRGRTTRPRRSPTACSRPCSSPTSSTRRRGWPSSATRTGGSSSSSTTRSSAASSTAHAAARWTRR